MLLCVSIPACAGDDKGTVGEVENIIDGILSFNAGSSDDKDVQSFIDSELTKSIGGKAEWYVLGLSGYKAYDFSKYRSALEKYLKENDIKGASSRLKFAYALICAGGDTSYAEKCVNDETIGGQSIISYVYGLHLYNNGFTGKLSPEEIADILLNLRHPDNGWSVTGEYGDVDVTAMVLQALAPIYNRSIRGESTESEKAEESGLYEKVKDMVENGVSFLSDKQLENGDFQSFGVRNAESTAQVITALSALGIDCVSDARFIKNGNSVLDGLKLYRLVDGSFSHKQGEQSNPTATVQSFYSLVAYIRMSEGKSPLYVHDKDSNLKGNTESVSENENGTDKTGAEDAGQETPSDKKDKAEDVTGTGSTDPETKGSETKDSETKGSKNSGYKKYVIIGILIAAVVICGILTIFKKHFKNHIFVLLAAAAGVLFVIFTDFSSAENYYKDTGAKENVTGKVTMSISCDIIKDKKKDEHIPEDGWILKKSSFDISEGETAYDILLEAAKKNNIRVEHEGSSEMVYISGINYLYEHDFGDLSGWVYKVNGELPSVGCGGYVLKDGDVIEWCYTLDLGNDSMK